ncbi:beta-Ala-His dipeptidase [Lentisphaerota bacterium WC36G]|nr:beta-Ala-His dipeptidase [Lentisphaerae bacterium WC36]
MSLLNNLQPQKLWYFFEKICSIPHPSKHEHKLRSYIIDLAKDYGCETKVDDYGNLLVIKKSQVGFENCKVVILQSHLDMVAQKSDELDFDFEHDPINLQIVDNEFVTACGTTLGADNGIGVATMCALIADKELRHGELRFLFTTEEEIGLNGVSNLAPEFMQGDILLNLDSEDEGEIFIGCAGGIRTDALIPIDVEDVVIFDDEKNEITQKCHLVVEGLHGGHSGCDIHHNLGNGLKILSEIVWEAISYFGNVRLRYVAGGNADNAIVRRAEAYLFIDKNQADDLAEFIIQQNVKYKQLLSDKDKNICISLKNIQPRNNNETAPAYSEKFQAQLLSTLLNTPNGVINYHHEMAGVVETSTNLAIVTADCLDKAPVEKEHFLKITTSQRSSDNNLLTALSRRIAIHFEQLPRNTVFHRSHYVGWTPNPHSEILRIVEKAMVKVLGIKPKVTVIHAGLECGALSEYNPKIDMVSIGPDITAPHSPFEKVRIESVEKFYDYLLETLKNIPHKTT